MPFSSPTGGGREGALYSSASPRLCGEMYLFEDKNIRILQLIKTRNPQLETRNKKQLPAFPVIFF